VRGRDAGWRGRLRTAAARFTPAVGSIAGAAAVAFVATGAWIYSGERILKLGSSFFLPVMCNACIIIRQTGHITCSRAVES